MIHSFPKHPVLHVTFLCFVFSLCSARTVQIGDICSKHDNPSSCNTIILSVPGAIEGVDIGSASLYLINTAHVNAFDTITLISEIIRNSSDAQTKQRYSSCTMDYTDVLLALTQAKDSYSSGNYSDMNFNGAVVTKDVKDCDTKAYDSDQVRIDNQYLADFSMIIMILADFLAGKY
ncbi:hypothetical protein PHAVU_001G038100 [Phaseolus vulgaris]|uniref:Pectinesterase inhibitor domain-containing protein n=1 Tax=Phaseolus vulgaris TaxID=3885 RepID=V7CS68_PHAVU|nr:hypothetical protein PHAVU_001G038100g [Phaseolus vulgaris]ESW33037.1 hypothetical protein PHAVU_001G038100g [Phaseolus vulgaris]